MCERESVMTKAMASLLMGINDRLDNVIEQNKEMIEQNDKMIR
jgi:hypothetical protein